MGDMLLSCGIYEGASHLLFIKWDKHKGFWNMQADTDPNQLVWPHILPTYIPKSQPSSVEQVLISYLLQITKQVSKSWVSWPFGTSNIQLVRLLN